MNQFLFGQPVSNPINPWDVIMWVALVVCLFIILREFFCWYWKINKIVSSLEDIKGILKTTNGILSSIQSKLPPQQKSGTPVKVEEIKSS
ncbi:hypothetical protein M1506_02210 [Patescibacteria group bacterium]|nr:hypothetical protein [Patescibacteria group bacterium]